MRLIFAGSCAEESKVNVISVPVSLCAMEHLPVFLLALACDEVTCRQIPPPGHQESINHRLPNELLRDRVAVPR
jgi:hypothetical protein